ncbi:hypothetical protein EXW96_26475 [Paenibacillus sp. JMULE4]|uniref:hypothetical protein n=1 Tax=Paenibacillus sp. JMULE4 TaxID=2518342 RepID=UPI0015770622|nr:hypothetical protein [Paenibacillus sp. JMULE4]NTZ20936.1 hypothetical protein [Paenibacillus sp. JMULE4]
MRELNIGDQTVRVRATPLALLFYKQEFKTDLLGDFLKMAQGMVGLQALSGSNQQLDLKDINLGQLDSVMFLQLIWAMAKADALGKQFPSFVEWVSSFESFDLFDSEILTAVMEEATSGFFRAGAKGLKQTVQQAQR